MPTDNLSQLRTLNSLLSLATGSDQELARHIEQAIEFSREQVGESHPAHEMLANSARRLLELHLDNRATCGFQHCDLHGQDNDPLWIRAQVLKSLRKLAGSREAILLISGLPTLVRPQGRRWSPSRRRTYQELVGYIQHLAAAHSSPRTRLQLIFL
ncbi:hypothetical protein H5P28_01240 [Ruficoccus amylovorans]|uniref:Uncharacterized protein n=1 Tax=Ruficoccus amylovorans TaxID=1804625 RepID=A0A842HBC8_9BACT|nr:hypothetical protein [Ruficoccus amylovorans]MBC2592874.1 hypothetical protein [Ruficoccus amylovorans]